MKKNHKRHMKIIEYLKMNKTVLRSELIEHFKIPKSTLSEDITKLKRLGYPINTSKHGYINLDSMNPTDYHEELTNSAIRKWLTLHAFNTYIMVNGGPVQKDQLLQYQNKLYNNLNIPDSIFSEYEFDKDLREFTDNGYIAYHINKNYEPVKRNSTGKYTTLKYHATPTTPRMYIIDYKFARTISTALAADECKLVFRNLDRQLHLLYPKFPDNKISSSDTVIDVNCLLPILKLPYNRYCLDIEYQTDTGLEIYKNFALAKILYTPSMNLFSIWGTTNPKANLEEYITLNISLISKINVTDTDIYKKIRSLYHSQHTIF